MSDFAALPGAVEGEGGILHFGSPAAEQRALAQGRAIVLRDDRAVLAVDGPDRLGWLDSLTSQALKQLAPGESTELLVLDPHGHIEHAAAVVDDGATTWLLVDRDDAEGLLTWLTRMRFRMQVTLRDASDEVAVVGAVTDRLVPDEMIAAPAGVPLVWRDPWPGVAEGGHAYAVPDIHPGLDRPWCEAIVPRSALAPLAELVTRDELAVAGLLAADALRVAAWRPRWAAEVDGRALPHEADWLRTAVHLAKGCYRGQETVAKVHNLGHPPRRLVLLHLDGSDSVLPERGAPVFHGDREVGTITSVAQHFEDGPIALALLKRTAPGDADLRVEVEGAQIAAAQQVIVPADAGATAGVPRLTRLSRRTQTG